MIRVDLSIILDGKFFYVDGIDGAEKDYRFAAAVILKITYGHDILSVNDLFIRLGQYLQLVQSTRLSFWFHISGARRNINGRSWFSSCELG